MQEAKWAKAFRENAGDAIADRVETYVKPGDPVVHGIRELSTGRRNGISSPTATDAEIIRYAIPLLVDWLDDREEAA